MSAALEQPVLDRRQAREHDRRAKPRNGRRATDPRASGRWRRLAWLFAAYAAYLSARALPGTVRKMFGRRHPA